MKINKKAGMSTSLILSLIIVGLVVVVTTSQGADLFNMGNNIVDSSLMSQLKLTNNSQTQEEFISDLPNAWLDSEVNNIQLKYLKSLTYFLFKDYGSDDKPIDYSSGKLLSFPVSPLSTKIENMVSMFILSTSEGVLVGFETYKDNHKKTFKLASTQDSEYSFLSGKDICVLPSSLQSNDAAKVLSYVAGLKLNNAKTKYTKEDILKILKNNVVDQLIMTNVLDGSDTQFYVESYKDETFNPSISDISDLGGDLLFFRLDDYVCFFQSKSYSKWSLTKKKVSVDFDTKPITLSNGGYLDASDLNKLIHNSNLKIDKGEYKWLNQIKN